MIKKLVFEVTVDTELDKDSLGEELAVFLEESFFNGEDVVGVEYVKQ